MAGSTSAVEWISLLADIPVRGVDWTEPTTDRTLFEPLSVSPFAAAVDALVVGRGSEFKVLDAVVLLVFVEVVDLVSVWDGTVILLPDNDVLHSHSSAEVAA
jgi:hypothetical protein